MSCVSSNALLSPWRACTPQMFAGVIWAPLLEEAGDLAARGHDRSAGKTRTLIGGLFKWAESQDIVGAESNARFAGL